MNTFVFGEPKKYIIMEECEKEYIVCEKRIYRDGEIPIQGVGRRGLGQDSWDRRAGEDSRDRTTVAGQPGQHIRNILKIFKNSGDFHKKLNISKIVFIVIF
jgi:hypothetical protein